MYAATSAWRSSWLDRPTLSEGEPATHKYAHGLPGVGVGFLTLPETGDKVNDGSATAIAFLLSARGRPSEANGAAPRSLSSSTLCDGPPRARSRGEPTAPRRPTE